MDKIFQIEPLEAFQNVSEKIITDLYYAGTPSVLNNLEDDVIAAAKQYLISVISECNFDLQLVKDVFNSKGWPEEKVKCLHGLIDRNKSDLLNAALNQYNSSYCETIVNFDWLVKLILGTSELKTLKYPLLQLVLSTLHKNGKQNNVIYDIHKDILLKMINALESIK
uniref:COMM domain-containing protein n=1 Tax=Heliothis virescens TaxID=7102 RepID=A0A2A4J145_HELVI